MGSDIMLEKGASVEHNELGGLEKDARGGVGVMGTTKLTGSEDEVLLVPAPSTDPRGIIRRPPCPYNAAVLTRARSIESCK